MVRNPSPNKWSDTNYLGKKCGVKCVHVYPAAPVFLFIYNSYVINSVLNTLVFNKTGLLSANLSLVGPEAFYRAYIFIERGPGGGC